MRKKNGLRLIVAGLGAIVVLLCASSLASADSGLEDADGGVSGDDWIQDESLEAQWSIFTSRVRELVPDDYAGAVIGDDGVYYIGFKAGVPDVAAEVLAEFPLDYVAVTDIGVSKVEAQQVSTVIAHMFNQIAPGTVAESGPTALSQQVVFTIDPSTIPEVAFNDEAGDTPVPFTIEEGFALSDTQTQRLLALLSHLAGIDIGDVQLNIVAKTVQPFAPYVSVYGG
ncbi:MAG: hypothetical protein LBJ43_00215 [Propionibacteriaceae bacterium]|jgi:hypothetical protein|nr:hypothetical protein [Propionibacteriaceae bacterium]